jgi:hypothetical protein
MNLPMFDQTILLDSTKRLSQESEAIRLSNEFRNKPAKTTIDPILGRIDTPAKTDGFDVETCDFNVLKLWLKSNTKKSASQIAFILRIMQVRFPDETTTLKNSNEFPQYLKNEMNEIESYISNDIYKIGEVGFQNKVFLDKQTKFNNRIIYKSNIQTKTKKNGDFIFKRV